ncbi:MAG: hypothetical protein MJE68_28265 [Proteobacteria bacterium]|nr:hypothetical protein [Pseudomonadota bacterium]
MKIFSFLQCLPAEPVAVAEGREGGREREGGRKRERGRKEDREGGRGMQHM